MINLLNETEETSPAERVFTGSSAAEDHPNPDEELTQETFRFSVAQALGQLSFVWPGVTRRHRSEIEQALRQIDTAFLAEFQLRWPRADSCCIARCGAHEIVLRGLRRGEPSVYWVEGRLLGSYRPFGILSEDIAAKRGALIPA